jgi:hypothetical protein
MVTKKKPKITSQMNTLDGVVVDTSGIDDRLTDRAKRFVFWYTFPGTDCFQHKTKSALSAGYAKKNAVSSGYKLCQNSIIKKEIERLSKDFVSEGIDSMYQKYINNLHTRAFFDPGDFIDGVNFKPISDIAPEKRVVIEQPIIDMKEGKIVGYQFGSRRAAMAEIKEIHREMHPGGDDPEIDEDELHMILETVGKSEITIQRRKKSAEFTKMAREAGLIDEPAHIIEEL